MNHIVNNDRRVRKTKKALHDSLFTLLENKPLSAVTVTELCEIADINRSTFYKYYPDIEGMMEHIEDDLLKMVLQNCEVSASFEEMMYAMIETVFEHRDSFRHVYSSSRKFRFKDMFFTAKRQDVLNQIGRGVPVSDVEKEYIFSFLRATGGIMELWINRDFKETPAEIAALCVRLINSVLAVCEV